MDDPSSIVINNDSSILCVPPVSTMVTVRDAVVLELDGLVVAKLDATYDLKDTPPALRHYAINAALNARRRLYLSHDRPRREPDPEETIEAPVVRLRWWERLRWWQT